MQNTVKYHIAYKEVSQKKFNEHLKKTSEFKEIKDTYENWIKTGCKTQRFTRWFKINNVTATLTYKLGSKWINIKTNRSKIYDQDEVKVVDPIRSYAIFSRVVKPLDYSSYVDKISHLGPYKDNHPDKKGEYEYAICYDVNKSFFNACNNPMPIELIDMARTPKKGEVGFTLQGTPYIGPSNTICVYIFTLGRLPGLDKYVKLYTKKLTEAQGDKNLIKRYKDEINMSIGNLKWHNPFLRNMIVYYSNTFIKSKVDENTIWSNTDSIISTVKRPDLDIGSEVGQFKIEHEGKIIQNVTGYQWLYGDYKLVNNGINHDKTDLFAKIYNRPFILGKDHTEELNKLNMWRYDYEKDAFKKISISELRDSCLLKEE